MRDIILTALAPLSWGHDLFRHNPTLAPKQTSLRRVASGVIGRFALMLLPVTFAIEGRPPMLTPKNLLGFGWLGIVGAGIAYALWFRGIGKLKASTVAFLGLLSSISAVLLDFLILKTSLTTLQIGGAELVFGSILISQLSREEENSLDVRSEHAWK